MFQPSDTIGPYTLIRTLGRGAFGEVWLAERRTQLLATQVALKFPLVAQNDVEAVRQEAALWLRASGHPNIVPVLDADIYDGQVVIASEYIAGGSLHDWMLANDGEAPSLEEAVAFAYGILAGLDYLHRSGLTHRDLKPENVLLQDGIPRLTDFGLARVLKAEARTESISGTPRYMAPETFSGSYSVASDLWSVGVMLHELLGGASPFPTGELMALILAIQSEPPAPLPDTVPERLRAIVARLLTKEPAARYVSASAVREALQSALQQAPDAQKPASSSASNNLPAQMTSFIGREREVRELKDLLTTTRLLTLTGSGGCGKTRLSLQVAQEVLEQFPDGVWLVELAPLADPALVPSAVASVLGLKETAGETITQTLTPALKTKRLLLILDNCEHVLEAAARLADTILRACPEVRLLVSSREALGIAGESAYRVPSLSSPDPKRDTIPELLSHFEAVRLFTERARAANANFTVTSQNAPALASICYRLDGIPLAIELAAARVRSLSVEEVNQKLDQRFRLLTGGSRTALPRQQTLRSLIDWSYDLLNEAEKALLCRLSVFAGGWTLESAEQVCAGEPVEEWEVLDLLTSLSDKSLVAPEQKQGATRYRLMETVRQYARDRQLESGDGEQWRHRHLAHCVSLAGEAEPQLNGASQQAWLERLETEHDNLRAALEWSCTQEADSEGGLRLAGSLTRFWDVRSYFDEGRSWLAALLDSRSNGHSAVRAKALNGAGWLAYRQGDYASARALHDESLAIWRELGDRSGIAGSLNNLGTVALGQGDYASARALQEESLAIRRELGDRSGIASSLNNLGTVARGQGDYASARALFEEALAINRPLGNRAWEAVNLDNLGNVAWGPGDYASARALYEESLAIRRELGDRSGIANSLNNLGIVARGQGDYAAARALYEESLAIRRELGDLSGIASSLNNLGRVAYWQGDYASARALHDESLAIFRELGDRRGIASSLNNLGNVTQQQGDYPAARALYEEGLAIKRELGDRSGIAGSLEGLAAVLAAPGSPDRAARIWGYAERLREEIGSPLPLNERPRFERQLSAARAALEDDAAFDAAWAEGRAMTMEQAIEFALEGERT